MQLLKHCERIKMIYTLRDWKEFLQGNKHPTRLQTYNHLKEYGQNVKAFDVTYDNIDLEVIGKWEDTSFAHAFGTHRDGFYDVVEIFDNDTMLPIALISDETVQKLLDLINQPKGRA
jgi:hypothetical protein